MATEVTNTRKHGTEALRQAVPRFLLTDEEAASSMGIGMTSFHELRRQEWFPRPVQLGPRLLRWSVAEIAEAIAKMPRQQHASEPAQLVRGKIARMKGEPPQPQQTPPPPVKSWRQV